ncbi:MAG: hypothetical protein ACP5I1_11665 [Candidatus Hinthialibacter sp.]
MFTQKWRNHWGLAEDPFNCEDADKDIILSSLDSSIVHWSFDRLYGNPHMAAPAIAFGEKGSGKSALRLMTRRRLEKFNEENPQEKIFLIDYIDFNPFLSRFRRAISARADDRQAAQDVVKRWKISDHLDAILSLGVTQFIDQILETNSVKKDMTRKQKMYLMLLTSLYYDSDRKTTSEAMQQIRKLIRYFSWRPILKWISIAILSLVSIAVALIPWFTGMESMFNKLFYILGALGLLGTWGWWAWDSISARTQSAWASRSVKILTRNSSNLSSMLAKVTRKERKEFVLPNGVDESSRYLLLERFIDLLETYGYKGVYVLIDRVDEPSLLSISDGLMRQFIEKLLDIKLLQYPRLGLKLFLPIEMDAIHRNASAEQLKHMRLDKSNLIPELKWSGQELYEIANQRLNACKDSETKDVSLGDMFEEGFDFVYLKDTLSNLGTPRYAFGFLATLISEYVKELPNDLPEDDKRWKISRSHFDVVRALWIDRSGVLRRVLN